MKIAQPFVCINSLQLFENTINFYQYYLIFGTLQLTLSVRLLTGLSFPLLNKYRCLILN